MQKGQNLNHPKKGDVITVGPIKKKKDIESIKTILRHNKPLDYALFVLGINWGLRASDLINLKVDDLAHLQAGNDFIIREKKTKKTKRITINKITLEAVQIAIQARNANNGQGYLFSGQRGPWTIQTVHRKVNEWTKSVNLKGNFGSHTLRKTFGYHKRLAGVDIPTLMEIFNHRTQKQTLAYLCIQADEIKNVYADSL